MRSFINSFVCFFPRASTCSKLFWTSFGVLISEIKPFNQLDLFLIKLFLRSDKLKPKNMKCKTFLSENILKKYENPIILILAAVTLNGIR